MPRPTDEYLATLTANTREYIAKLESTLAGRAAEIERLRAALAEARTHYGCGPGRRYRFDGDIEVAKGVSDEA